jgi:hypothetical protein
MSKYFLFISPKLTQKIITKIIVKIKQRHGDTNGGTNCDTNGDTNDTRTCSTAHLYNSQKDENENVPSL